jgi:hypothetical protein
MLSSFTQSNNQENVDTSANIKRIFQTLNPMGSFGQFLTVSCLFQFMYEILSNKLYRPKTQKYCREIYLPKQKTKYYNLLTPHTHLKLKLALL